MANPTQARVNEYFNYDPETGIFTVKERPASDFSNTAIYRRHLAAVGSVPGSVIPDGYIKIYMDGHYFNAHRLAWLAVHGEWVKYPEYEIDHIDGDPSNNRLANLRKVSKSDNQRNAGMRVNNTSSIHGVNWKPKYNSTPGDGRWVARIWNGPKHVYLGAFKTLKEAQIARRAAERVLGFTRTQEPGHALKKSRHAIRKIEKMKGAAA